MTAFLRELADDGSIVQSVRVSSVTVRSNHRGHQPHFQSITPEAQTVADTGHTVKLPVSKVNYNDSSGSIGFIFVP